MVLFPIQDGATESCTALADLGAVGTNHNVINKPYPLSSMSDSAIPAFPNTMMTGFNSVNLAPEEKKLAQNVVDCATRSLQLERDFIRLATPEQVTWWSEFKSSRIPAIVNTCWSSTDKEHRDRALINCSLCSVALLDGSTSIEIDSSVPASERFWDAPSTKIQVANLEAYLARRYAEHGVATSRSLDDGKVSPWYNIGARGSLQSSEAVSEMQKYPIGTRFVVFLGKAPVINLPGSHYIYAERVPGGAVVFVDAQPNAIPSSTSVPYLNDFDFEHVQIYNYDSLCFWSFQPAERARGTDDPATAKAGSPVLQPTPSQLPAGSSPAGPVCVTASPDWPAPGGWFSITTDMLPSTQHPHGPVGEEAVSFADGGIRGV